jgi:magnesium transporter
MARFFKKRDVNKGLAPGTLVFIGDHKEETIRIRVIDYTKENLSEDELADISKSHDFIKTNTVTWINVDGLHDVDLMNKIQDIFDLHPLLTEDIMNTGQRPKFEEYEDVLFVVLKMLQYDIEKQIILAEQLSMVIGKTFLLTFQERRGDVFDPVRERIRKQIGRIRITGIDYLAYALLDIIVDNYMRIIERMGEQIEDMEEEILTHPDSSIMEKINTFKREINFLRKSVRPVREAVLNLIKSEHALIHKRTIPFLKDLEDHITQAVEAIDSYSEMLTNHLNIYNSALSNKMNDVMKVLTIFASIFIPLTFIAGIYGTNFDYLPELHFKYSYFIFWGIMVILAVSMLLFFRKRKWF